MSVLDGNLEPSFKCKYGVSQGRLTKSEQLQRFPSEAWQQEFSNASKLGVSFIELLTEREFNSENPVWSEEGRQEIKDLCLRTGCKTYSLCIDYVINHSLLDDKDETTLEHVKKAFSAASLLNCKIVIFPLLEASNLLEENAHKFVPIFKYLSNEASKYDLKICVESLLKANELKKFLNLVGHPNVKAVFDTGNRANTSSDLYSEIVSLGNYVEHVHIKDKNKYGENVILGTGLVDFRSIFSALKKINYAGALNFETTRGQNPLETIRFHIGLCEFFRREVNKDI